MHLIIANSAMYQAKHLPLTVKCLSDAAEKGGREEKGGWREREKGERKSNVLWARLSAAVVYINPGSSSPNTKYSKHILLHDKKKFKWKSLTMESYYFRLDLISFKKEIGLVHIFSLQTPWFE